MIKYKEALMMKTKTSQFTVHFLKSTIAAAGHLTKMSMGKWGPEVSIPVLIGNKNDNQFLALHNSSWAVKDYGTISHGSIVLLQWSFFLFF